MNIETLLHPTILKEETDRKETVMSNISSCIGKMPELKHFLEYKAVDVDLIASCVLDAAYMNDFLYNRYSSIPQEEHSAFRNLVSELAETL